ncbi:MAG: HD domain-containing protein [Bacteroidetes bacterium]|nr:HD domain-containing protein [Bacteroidota bacterium]
MLTYHCVAHTLDVVEATRWLADSEKIESHDKILLLTASSYHDAGMLVQYIDHESASVSIARQMLPGFGFSKPDIDEIARLIMVTKLPQRASNHHEQIICDADLDYLGRDEFLVNSFKLRLEWQVNNIRNTTLQEWFNIQVNFLTDHQYFTRSAMQHRNEKKIKHLEEIKQLLSTVRVKS